MNGSTAAVQLTLLFRRLCYKRPQCGGIFVRTHTQADSRHTRLEKGEAISVVLSPSPMARSDERARVVKKNGNIVYNNNNNNRRNIVIVDLGSVQPSGCSSSKEKTKRVREYCGKRREKRKYYSISIARGCVRRSSYCMSVFLYFDSLLSPSCYV